MNKKLGYVVALTAVLAMSSCSKKLGDFAADYFTTNPTPLEVVGEKVPAAVTGNIPPKFFVKNAEVTVTPYFVYGDNEVASQPYSFQGQNVRGNNPVIDYKEGGTMTIPVGFEYNPAMADGQLELAFQVTQGNNTYVLPRVTVAKGVLGTAYMADTKTLVPTFAEDKYQRIINEKYAADIMFLINVANIRDNQLTTDDMVNLWEQIDASRNNDNVKLNDINIKAYASPDGAYDFNYKLAEKRQDNTNDYIMKKLQSDSIDIVEITKDFTPEDWEGFKKLIEATDLQDKELVVSVLSNFEDPEEQEKQLRQLAAVYPIIADEILPQLRYSRITASFDVMGRSDEEIISAISTDPASLSIDEILYAASKVNSPAQKEAIYAVAAKYFPNDYRAWNNLGAAQYIRGEFSEAAASFNKAKNLAGNSAEVALNQGIMALNNGDYQAAMSLLGKAGKVEGLNQALGTYYIKMGDNAKAASAFADAVSNNAALSQILTKNYSKAGQILNAISNPDATTYYLKAIVGARTNNENMVVSNLKNAIKLDKSMAQKALTDLEFINYNIANLLQ